jgi:hypothetical protein
VGVVTIVGACGRRATAAALTAITAASLASACSTADDGRVVRWSVGADREGALSQVWVKAAARSVGHAQWQL